ncbi:MAG: hypothetical protein DA407_07435 [Bacteroidetes bacterium]|nr:MAG: hypothetical protein DA407_07435 [Bacteroidota bacterium]
MNILSLTPKASLILNPFVDRFNEGGPFFMSLILICLLLTIFFLVKAFISSTKDAVQSKKMMRLTAEVGLLGLVIGFLASILGLIQAFDAVEGIGGEISPALLAGGIKVSFLTILFGTFTFIVSRIGLLILKWKHKA